MSMKVLSWTTCMVAAIACGCGNSTTPEQAQTGSVAVIDLDSVAKELGRDVEITRKLKTKQNELNGQLAALKNAFLTQIQAKQKEFGTPLTEEQQKQLKAMQIETNYRLQQAQAQARAAIANYRQQLVAEFRKEVLPHAQTVAKEKGFSTIVPKNDMIISVEPVAEIAGLVATEMKSKGLNYTAPAESTASTKKKNTSGVQQVSHEKEQK